GDGRVNKNRQLVAERLAAAGGEDREGGLVFLEGDHDVFLAGSKAGEAEMPLQKLRVVHAQCHHVTPPSIPLPQPLSSRKGRKDGRELLIAGRVEIRNVDL